MEKLNIAELLKDCPKGMELDCTMYEKVTLTSVNNKEDIDFPIRVAREDGGFITLTKYGQYTNAGFAKCVIFPKGKTTWEGFQRPFKDGDVVATLSGNQIFIFKENAVNKDGSFSGVCYFGYQIQENKLFKERTWSFSRHATEEEKQKFFDTIKANGYKWNAETKTLEKLIEPKFKVGDRVLWKYDTETPRTILEVKHTTKGGYVYWINCEGCTSRWWDETELIPIPNKFDITTLKPFESRVLTRGGYRGTWKPAEFGFYDETEKVFYAVGGNCWVECIPYDGNEHLLGTTNDCDEYFKTWE